MVPVSSLEVAAARAMKRQRGSTRKLPDEISFLDGLISEDVLRRAAARAAAHGVGADEVLIAEGWIDKRALYARLTARVGACLAGTGIDFAPGVDWRGGLRTGVVPLRDGRWLMAPRGRAIALLLERLSRGTAAARIVLAPPSQYERILCEAHAAELAGEAADRLSRERPALCARGGAWPRQKRFALLMLHLLPYELAYGLVLWNLALLALALVMCTAVLVRILAALLALRRSSSPPLLRDIDLPRYSVLVALYREAEVAPSLVEAMTALDYPRAKHEVIFVVEAEDAQTRAALEAQRLPPHVRIVVAPEGAPRTKPRALNVGLMVARGQFAVVYDAEDRPEPDQLRKAAAQFHAGPPNLAVLQAMLKIENRTDSWLTRLFAIDYASQFEVLLPGLARLGLPLPLGGTSNHFRVDALRRAGGWDAWNVTEDADLGLRLGRFGFRAGVLASATWEEAPPGLRDWFPQRRRWLKGWMQTFVTHTRQPLRLFADLGAARAVHVLALLAANTFGPAVGLWITIYVLHQSLFGDFLDAGQGALVWLWASIASLGVVSILLPTGIALTRGRLWSCAPWLLLRPLHWLCVTAAALDAMRDLWRRPHHWSKTRHGIAKKRTEQAAPPFRQRL